MRHYGAGGKAAMMIGKRTKSVLKEPLTHFLLLGLIAFFYMHDSQQDAPPPITISISDQEQIKARWRKQWGREPTEHEYQTSLKAEVRQRVLYQEARALNLHLDDIIVQRRLVQKLEQLTEAQSMMDEPVEARLEKWFGENRELYRAPPRLSFQQIYFDPDKRTDAVADAEAQLAQLKNRATVEGQGDNGPFDDSMQDTALPAIATTLGESFANRLHGHANNQWAGPFVSGVGVHLVKVSELTPGELPALTDVRQRVLNDYMYMRRNEALENYYARVRQKYQVTIAVPEEYPQPATPVADKQHQD